MLKADPGGRERDAAIAGASISRDGHTAIVTGGRGAQAEADGARRRPPEGAAAGSSAPATSTVSLTGASGMWSDFNAANRSAMMKSRAVLLAGDARDPRARVRLAGRRRACR